MVGLVENGATASSPPPEPGFTVSHQKVHLDIDLRSRKLKGRVEITINPNSTDLKTVKLNCRQAHITKLLIGGKATSGLRHVDPYKLVPLQWAADVHQWHMLQERVDGRDKDAPEPDLTITVPKSVKIWELEPTALLDSNGRPTGNSTEADVTQTKSLADHGSHYTPIMIAIEYTINNIRDGLIFQGWEEGDLTYPHAYTGKTSSSSICCLFPCVDSIEARCTWEISIKTPRTLGDAFGASPVPNATNGSLANGNGHQSNGNTSNLGNEDQARDLMVICSGDVTDEIVDPSDPSKKTTSFYCSSTVSAQHIGIAIGPFEHVNLAAFRDSDEDDKLGGSAIPVHGFCLPGRASEVENTCLPLAKAIDFFVTTFGRYPYTTYKLCFVDGLVADHVDTATLSIFSNRMLFPEDIIDPMDHVTREIVYGLACQWCGVDIVPSNPSDIWAVVGIAYYITDLFLRKLAGHNEYRFFQTRACERVVEMDVNRPCIYDSGRYLDLDSSHMALIAAKAPLVLFILDRRLTKASGSTGLSRIISRIFLNANIGDIANGALSTAYFIRMCERLGHTKLDVFFEQWVLGAGCPHFQVTQRFNKKRLIVEMHITQVQKGPVENQNHLESSTFMRDVKEYGREVYAGPLQKPFTGPMTIRIHEADGTPYEHIVDVANETTKVEVPYSTKYKRLKRTRRAREKLASGLAGDPNAEGEGDTLLYCLGDILQSPEEEADWRLSNFSKEDEDRMSGESYEWIRMDADFEWICKLRINMPGYMFVSQLQQDRDVSAQYDTISFLRDQKPHHLISTFLVKTVMDTRYFHGIRTAAAAALANQAKEEVGFIGLFHLRKAFNELFCVSDTGMAMTNDFSDRAAYYVQCAIIRAVSQIRDAARRSPLEAREFILSKLRENDNSNNDFSDCYYIALMMKGLADAQASAPLRDNEETMMTLDDDGDDYRFQKRIADEIDRHRRIDEWIPSYHNVISVAALDCKRVLAKAGIMPRKAVEYLQYTQDGTYDDLRIAAFSNLAALEFLKEDHVLKWFLFSLGHDPSPYVRAHLLSIFGSFLGTTAIGSDTPLPSTTIHTAGSLVIEQDSTTTARATSLARKRTIPGALAALKPALNTNPTLKQSLWSTMNAPPLTIPEISALLAVAELLYEPVTALTLALKYPRYWRATNMGYVPAGNGRKAQQIVRFTRTERVRTAVVDPAKRLKFQPAAAVGVGAGVGPGAVARRESGMGKPGKVSISIKPPKRPSVAGHSGLASAGSVSGSAGAPWTPGGVTAGGGAGSPGTPGEGPQKLKLKLKFGGGGGQGK